MKKGRVCSVCGVDPMLLSGCCGISPIVCCETESEARRRPRTHSRKKAR